MNGNHAERLRIIEAQTREIRDSLTISVDRLAFSIDSLTVEVRELVKMFKTAVPIKLVVLMFLVVIGIFFGVEGVKILPKLLL